MGTSKASLKVNPGRPIFECEPISSQNAVNVAHELATFERKPSDIVFVRSRMLYARAALNARGLVHFGLRHIRKFEHPPRPSEGVLIPKDALNRFPVRHSMGLESANVGDIKNHARRIDDNALRIMMYMFPRQFGLHNAFTSHVDPTKTAQKFQDYTLREEEIFAKFAKNGADSSPGLDVQVPKRLRGKAEHLVQRLQTFHARCSYAKLLEHYCSVRNIPPSTSRIFSAAS